MLRAGIEHFFYIGGNDSSDTVRIVSERRPGHYPLRSIHIPKTIDNDLVGNDHTPGFPRRRASWPRPSPAPTSTTPRCRACTWRW